MTCAATAEPVSDPDMVRHQSAIELVRVWQEASRRIERAFAEVSAAEEMLVDHATRSFYSS